jgi:thiol:disulfide interchange protein
MERAFIRVFDHASWLFPLLIVAAAALAYRIGRPRRWFHWIADVPIAGVIVGSVLAIFFSSIHSALNERLETLSFTTADNAAVHRLSDYRGKVVVLNIWATWCPPCRREMPELNRIADAWRGRDVVVLAVSDETWEQVGARDYASFEDAIRAAM